MYNISVELEELKNNLTNMYVAFNNLNNKSAIDNRNSDNILDVKSQFNMDRTFINSLRNKEKPDSVYNFKKDFLVLSFDQTEDQNSLTYKRKVLSNYLLIE